MGTGATNTSSFGYVAQVDKDGNVISGASGSSSPQVQGNSASAVTDAGNPVKVGAVYNSALPTYTTGQRTDLQAGNRGSLSVQLMVPDNGSPIATSGDNADGQATSDASRLQVVARGYMFNGTTYDRVRKANVYGRIASSAASGNPATLKASAGDLMGFWGQNGAAITYLQIYNKASAPVIGTDTPIMTFPIAANAAFSQQINNGGAYLGTGVSYAFTTDAAGTTGAAAAAVVAFTVWGA